MRFEDNQEAETEAFPTTPSRVKVTSTKALIVEDIRRADLVLKSCGFECDRITHNELLSTSGTEYTRKLMQGEYSVLWIGTPDGWHIRVPTAKTAVHWQRTQQWIQKAVTLDMTVILFGPPGFLWNLPNIKETLEAAKMIMPRMRLCHFGDKFDKKQPKPSGSYLQLATNATLKKQWNCQCKIPIPDHIIDWYGRGEEQTEWRKQISLKYATEVGDALHLKDLCSTACHAIQDDVSFSLPTMAGPGGGVLGNLNPSPGTADASTTTVGREARNKFNNTVALPTDAKVKAKVRLAKMKELGIKVKKKFKITEPGNDDCGDDIRGLGDDVILLTCDVAPENDDDTSDDEDNILFISIPRTTQDNTTNIFSAVSSLCYGRHKHVDLIELCGGAGRISQVAFRRGLISGGNLDLFTVFDLRDPSAQRPILD